MVHCHFMVHQSSCHELMFHSNYSNYLCSLHSQEIFVAYFVSRRFSVTNVGNDVLQLLEIGKL